MSDLRQVIVMRKDLNMRKGKIAAQAAHASMAVLTQRIHHPYFEEDCNDPYWQCIIDLTPDIKEWLDGSFTKICVYVESEEELLAVHLKAVMYGLPCSLITDNGLTEFHGVKTTTCCAIGPARKEVLDEITGHLPLY